MRIPFHRAFNFLRYEPKHSRILRWVKKIGTESSFDLGFGGVYSGGGGSGLNTVANSGRSSGGRARGAEYLDVDAAGDGGLGGGDEQLPRTPNSQQALLYKTTSDIHKYFDTQNNNAGSGEGYDSGEWRKTVNLPPPPPPPSRLSSHFIPLPQA